MEAQHILEGKINGYYYENSNPKGNVIVFGGGGGELCGHKAEVFYKLGYSVLSLYYFGKENLPNDFAEIPLDFFNEVLAFLSKKATPLHPITIVGYSKGAELSLLLASLYKEIDNVIAYAPSCYLFQSPNFKIDKSSFSYNGTPLPYIKYKMTSLASLKIGLNVMSKKPIALRNFYKAAIKHSKNLEEARIKIENFKGNLLLIAGDDDMMWPADEMIKNLVNHHKEGKTEFIVFNGVGHNLGGKNSDGIHIYGGSLETNKQADIESDELLEKFLTNISNQ